MSPQFAHVLLGCAAFWCACGFAFGLWFAWRGASRIDHAAAEGTLGFRLLLLPGALLLWPWLLVLVVRASPRSERSPHRKLAAAGERP